jgi:hypothetical protein
VTASQALNVGKPRVTLASHLNRVPHLSHPFPNAGSMSFSMLDSVPFGMSPEC